MLNFFVVGLGLLLCQAVSKVRSQVTVTVYDHSHYRGESRKINVLSRCENILDFNDRASSIKTSGCVVLYADSCCQGATLQVTGDTANFPQSFNDELTSLSPCGFYKAHIPESMQETWLGHSQTMRKMVEDGDIAVYYNDQMNERGLQNHRETLKQMWRYVKATYGGFGPEGGRVSVFIHANVHPPQYGFNSLQTYFDIDSHCRNLIDLVGGRDEYAKNLTGIELEIFTHEMSHIVEFASKGVHGSPSYQLWGDSKWAEIFIYDVYNAIGMTKERERVFQQFWDTSDNFPNPHWDTFWFRDWFYPIYQDHGGAWLLNNYFSLLAQHFPRNANGWQYIDRSINLGEFVHFFSGAAGQDLKPRAEYAFSWNDKNERELQRAKSDFPGIVY